MSTITQRIPNLLLGISQQPDNRKFPGQLKDSVNAFPDYALGLLKRPGGQYVSELNNASPSGKWFSILRDKQEKYVAQYENNKFSVWSLISSSLGPAGSPRAVDMGSNAGVPASCNITTLKTNLTAYNTAVADTAAKLTLLHAAQANYSEILAGQSTTLEPVFEVRFNYTPTSPGTITFDQYLYSGIIKYPDNTYLVRKNDVTIGTGATLPAGYVLGKDLTDEYPVLASANTTYNLGVEHPTVSDQNAAVTGVKIYEGIEEVAAVNTPAELTAALTAMNTAQTNYDNAVTAEATAKSNYETELGSCTITALPGPTLLINDAGTGLTDGSYTNESTGTATSGATGLTVDLTISGGVVTEATINTDPGTYLGADIITVTSFAGVELQYVNEAYLKGATADDIELLTLNDYTFVLNKAKTVKYKATKTASKPYEAFAVVKVVGTGHYKIYLDNVLAGTYNAGTGGDVDAIVADLVGDINGNTFNGKTYSATAVGPGLYISTTDGAFEVSAVGSQSENALFVFQETTPTVADLPVQCKNGYVVKIVNSIDIDVDDMYVKFVADNNADYGAGVWEETTAPDIKYIFDELTMPHQLVRQADGSFTFDPVSWENRLIGDEDPDLDPSFLNQKINNIFFYRNRLGFLSNEAVVLSRAGDYFNFWSTTALSVTDDDPIDITASSVRPVNHRYVRPVSVGLVLFSDTEQFILTTDADILSPKTAKINELSSYECDDLVEAVNMGTSLAFVSKTPLFTRLYELAQISTDRPPEMSEQTKIVPELIPESITSLIASPALSLVCLGTAGSNVVYQYRFLDQGQQRASSWYKWELTGNLLDQFFDANTYYAVVEDGTNVFVQSYDLTQANEEGFLTLTSGEKTDICLDNWSINPYRTYDSVAKTTRVFLPFDHISGKTFSVLVLGGYIGGSNVLSSESVGAVLYPTVQGTAGAYYVDIDGDYRGRDLITGYVYNMEVELPKFFVTSSESQSAISDFTSDLIIHRVKVSTGLSGPVKYQVTITGRPEWNQTIEATTASNYNLNSVNMSADATHTVPIYQRNENLTFKIIGDTPFPVSLLSLNWEGKYNTGFYRRS